MAISTLSEAKNMRKEKLPLMSKFETKIGLGGQISDFELQFWNRWWFFSLLIFASENVLNTVTSSSFLSELSQVHNKHVGMCETHLQSRSEYHSARFSGLSEKPKNWTPNLPRRSNSRFGSRILTLGVIFLSKCFCFRQRDNYHENL